jgi:hypothetical protein
MGLSAMKDGRRKERVAVQQRLRLHWNDPHGQLKSTTGEVVDVSATGLRMVVDKSIEPQTLVSLEARGLRIAGVATVRHCVRSSVNHYTIGLQFGGGLQWRGVTQLPT